MFKYNLWRCFLMKYIRFSVIIPLYNARKYLRKCLNSVINQTYKNFEIIVINDGSTDGSGDILKKYADKYKNIIVIEKENEGVAKARIDGIKKAQGDYITFLDSDDWYELNLLERLNLELNKEEFSIVQFGYERIKYGFSKGCRKEEKVFDFSTENIYGFISGYGLISYEMWNKTYSADILKNAISKNDVFLKVGEDTFFNLIILSSNNIKRVSIIPECLYNYRLGSGITSAEDKIMYFEELMKSKLEICNYAINSIKDEKIVNIILSDVAVKAKCYSNVITEKCKSEQEKEKMIYDVIYENPTVKKVKEYFKNDNTDIAEIKSLKDFKTYMTFIKNYEAEYRKELTFYQKLKRIIPIIK